MSLDAGISAHTPTLKWTYPQTRMDGPSALEETGSAIAGSS